MICKRIHNQGSTQSSHHSQRLKQKRHQYRGMIQLQRGTS